MEVKILMRGFINWLKLLQMNDKRYPRRMHERLKKLDANHASCKFNLYLQLHQMLTLAQYGYLLQQKDPNTIKIALLTTTAVVTRLEFENDVQ